MTAPTLDELYTLAADAITSLKSRGLTIATAEATTGGLVGHLLVSVPGSSAVFRGGVAPYSNAMKRAIGVPDEVLKEHGAVSQEAANALAEAIRNWAAADIGLAETGIAGPTGGTAERPTGTFWIAVATSSSVGKGPSPDPLTRRFVFDGDRVTNQHACVLKALEMLHATLTHG